MKEGCNFGKTFKDAARRPEQKEESGFRSILKKIGNLINLAMILIVAFSILTLGRKQREK